MCLMLAMSSVGVTAYAKEPITVGTTAIATEEAPEQTLFLALNGGQYGDYTVSVNGAEPVTASTHSEPLSVHANDEIRIDFIPAENGKVENFYLDNSSAPLEEHHEQDIADNSYTFILSANTRGIVVRFGYENPVETVSYVDELGKASSAEATILTGAEFIEYYDHSYRVVLGEENADTWYAVKSNVIYSRELDTHLVLRGNVHLIVADGATLEVKSSIKGGSYNQIDTLSIYGQTGQSGTVSAGAVDCDTLNLYSGKLAASSVCDVNDTVGIKGGTLDVSGNVEAGTLEIIGGIANVKGKAIAKNLTLGCRSKDDYITIGTYENAGEGTMKYADGQRLTDGEGNLYSGLMYDNTFPHGKTLRLANTVTFYEDAAGTEIWRVETLPAGSPLEGLSGYETETDLLTRDGYTFAGWATEPNIEVHSYRYDNGAINEKLEGKLVDWNGVLDRDICAYPIWIRDRLEVRLVANDDEASRVVWGIGDDGKQQSDVFTVNIDEKIRMEGLEGTTRTGYVLDGWYTQNGVKWNGGWGVTPEYCDKNADGSPIVQVNDARKFKYYTVTLAARWTPTDSGQGGSGQGGSGQDAKKYTITFDSAGGTPVASISQASGTPVTAPKAPVKDHYTFEGWHPALPNTMPASNLSLTASWKPIEYTITFDSAGGTSVEAVKDIYGARIEAPADPERDGYVFVSWLDANDDAVTFPLYMPGENTKLTAKWMTIQEAQKTDLSKARVTVADATYTGENLEPAVTVTTLEGEALKADSDYTVSYADNQNAGTGTVTVVGIGSYRGEVTKPFNIAKAKGSVAAKAANATVKTTYGKAKTVAAKKAFQVTTNTSKGKVSYTRISGDKKISISKAGKITVKKGLAAGTYTVKVKATAAETDNYEAATSKALSFKVKVAKAANVLKLKGKTAKAKAPKTLKASKVVKVSKNASGGKLTYEKLAGNKKIAVGKAGKVTVKKGLAAGTYKVKVKVTSKATKNYKAKSKNVSFKVKIA